MTLVWRRMAPGSYEARVGPGERDRYLVEHYEVPAAESGGYGRVDEWTITFPGSVRPDTMRPTLSAAKAACNEWSDA